MSVYVSNHTFLTGFHFEVNTWMHSFLEVYNIMVNRKNSRIIVHPSPTTKLRADDRLFWHGRKKVLVVVKYVESDNSKSPRRHTLTPQTRMYRKSYKRNLFPPLIVPNSSFILFNGRSSFTSGERLDSCPTDLSSVRSLTVTHGP